MRRWYQLRFRHKISSAYWICSAITIALSAATPLPADVSFPYTAVIVAGEAEVRSGPGTDFYATTRLTEGTTVEVYRHVADGWCAIRPPSNSFSWIAAEHLELTDNPTLGRVINVPVKTRVGSEYDDIHDVEYVALRKGEIVQLLGSKTLREASGEPPRRWFKVAPPAGEFRWVHAEKIRESEHLAAHETAVGTEAIRTFDLAEQQQDSASDQPNSSSSESKLRAAFVEVSEQVQGVNYERVVIPTSPQAEPVDTVSKVHIDGEDDKSDNDDSGKPVHDDSGQPNVENTHVNAVTWEAVARPTEILAAPEPRSFRDRYNALNVMLSRAVLQDIELWHLDSVNEQAGLLLGYATTLDEKELVGSLIKKTNEFQQLQQRRTRMDTGDALDSLKDQQTGGDQNRNFALPAQLPEFDTDAVLAKGPDMPKLVRSVKKSSEQVTDANLLPSDELDNSIFDANGILVAVRSRRPDMPRYALTDSNGQIARFVSVDADSGSLDRFVNLRVGVLGKVGLLRKFNKPHIVASRVVALQQ